jgi:hypothetical protein
VGERSRGGNFLLNLYVVLLTLTLAQILMLTFVNRVRIRVRGLEIAAGIGIVSSS